MEFNQGNNEKNIKKIKILNEYLIYIEFFNTTTNY